MINRIRFLAAAVLAALSLSSCAGFSEITPQSPGTGSSIPESGPQEERSYAESQTASPLFSALEQYPIVDGSTANLPLMARVLHETCGVPEEEAETYVNASGTDWAWQRLSQGEADLLLVYEAPQETKEALKDGPTLEITPVGRDALVFLVNSENPVTDLTTEQLQNIYTGKTTNWKELGGADQEIFPFQRNKTSGSQTLFLKLLMNGMEPMKAPEELVAGGMEGLIHDVASYDNGKGAIGYSVYYYASNMNENPALRMLTVNGVAPTGDSIADGSYPLLNDFYMAIRGDEPEESPARTLRQWILSEQGSAAFREAGYVPLN